MKIGVLREQNDDRVAMVPAVAGKLMALGVELLLEKGAGARAGFKDSMYENLLQHQL